MVEIGRLFWKKVITADDFIIGEIESADLEETTWQLKSFYVSLNDDATKKLGFERPYFGKVFVCLPVSTIGTVKEVVILNKTFQELQELRECKK